MTFQTRIATIEAELSARSVSVKAFCDRAGIARSTWDRWKAGKTQPNWGTLQRVEDVFGEMTRQDAA